MAFANAFHLAYSAKYDVQAMKILKTPVSMMTVIFSHLTFGPMQQCQLRMRLLLDLKIVKRAYESLELPDEELIRAESNIADGLTKVKKNTVLLENLLTCRLDHPTQHYSRLSATLKVILFLKTAE